MVCKTNGVTPGNGNNSVYTGKSGNTGKQLAELQYKPIDFRTKKFPVKNTPMMDHMMLDPMKKRLGNISSDFLQKHPEAINDFEKVANGKMSIEDLKAKYNIE